MTEFMITKESIEQYVELKDNIEGKLHKMFYLYSKQHNIRYNHIISFDLTSYWNCEESIQVDIDTSTRHDQDSDTKYIPLRWLYMSLEEVSNEFEKQKEIKKQKELALKAMQEIQQLEQDRIEYERLKEKFGI